MLDRYDQDLLLDYLEGELDAGRRAQLDAMLAEDPQLAALLGEMSKDRAALRSLPQAEAPSDLVHDVTQTLERRMLLDESIDDTAPIPLSRARAGAPTRSISWGRVVGLTGLAASVALAAGILVITLDDPLQRTANQLADNTAAEEAEEAGVESTVAEDTAAIEASAEGLAARDQPGGSDALPFTEAPNTTPGDIADRAIPATDNPLGEALALGSDAVNPRRAVPEPAALAPELERNVLGPTAAIGAIQPRQQLVLFTDAPQASRKQLVAFCVANGIPVVQPDQLAQQPQAPQGFGSDPSIALDNTNADADADEPLASYALLINESQLDTLVHSLNNDVTIEPKRAGKASPISNQAALLTELPEEAYPQRAAAVRKAVTDGQPADDAQPGPAQESESFASQQTIQLRSPDLGSDYNNTRNAYNLKSKQQSGYGQQARARVDNDVSDSPAPAITSNARRLETKPQAQLSEAEKATTEDKSDLADLRASADEPKESEHAAGSGEPTRKAETPRQVTPTIDPTRGNWLSAHLPVADTTPLLLSWRESQSTEPTKLVPVMIKLAEREKVNTLRMRQQAEYANRANAAAGQADTGEVDEVANDIESETPEPTPPAEPGEPTE